MLNIKKAVKSYWFVIVIIIIAFLIRFLVAAHSPLKYTDSDEAFQGVIAKHIIEKGEYSLFTWHASYGGDVMLQIYFATVFFIVFGISALSLKLAAITTSLIIMVMAYFFIKKFFSKEAAIITSLLLAMPTTLFLRLSLHVGYHLITVIFDIILIYIFYQLFFCKKGSLRNFALFGFLSAIAFYLSDSVMVLLITFFMFWFIFDKLFFLKKPFLAYLSSFIFGSIPLIYFNLTHNFSHIKHLFSETIVHKLVCKYNLLPKVAYCLDNWVNSEKKSLASFFTKDLPDFFGSTNFRWAYYIIFLAAFIYLVYANKKQLSKLILGIIPKKKFSVLPKDIKLELFILVYALLYIVVYYFRGMSKQRYLYGLYVWVPFIIVLFIIELKNKLTGKRLKILIPSLIIGILIIIGLIETSVLLSGNLQYGSSKEESVPEIINFLDSKGIKYVYTDMVLKWFLAFESNEEIIGSCDNMCFCGGEGRVSKYPAYEAAVDASDNYAYIVREGSTLNKKLVDYLTLNNITYKKEAVKDKLIYYSFSKEARPKDTMVNCTTNSYVFE